MTANDFLLKPTDYTLPTPVLERIAQSRCKSCEYSIVFKKDGKPIHEEPVDYDEIYEVLRRYSCMHDTLEILTAGTVI